MNKFAGSQPLKHFLAIDKTPSVLFDSVGELVFENNAFQRLEKSIPIPLDDLKSAAKEVSFQSSDSIELEPLKYEINDQSHSMFWYVSKVLTADDDQYYLLLKVDLSKTLMTEKSEYENTIYQQKNALDEAAIVAITDRRGIIGYVNSKFIELSGYSEEELLGKTHAIINSHHHEPEFFVDMWKTIGRGKVWKGEVKNKTKTGGFYWVDTTIVPMLDINGRPESYVAIRHDITEKVEAREALAKERARTSYAEKMASLGELAAGIAHELGNPLASINAWLDVLLNSLERGDLHTEAFQKTATGIKQKTDRMAKILKGMLSYARDGSKDPATIVNISSLVKDVIDYTHHKLNKASVVVTSNLPEYAPVECRETEISQVLVNLILNSCDAIVNLESKWINLSVKDTKDTVMISITDSGSGIDKEKAAKIMKPFYTTKAAGKGTGLGLSISQTIIENHNGAMTIDFLSPNTKFDISLPKKLAV